MLLISLCYNYEEKTIIFNEIYIIMKLYYKHRISNHKI
jgi:hypothetical protein